jgi:recombinational DNA repair ATPase RecF
MRIDRLEVENFKKFKKQSLELHRQFTLLVGGMAMRWLAGGDQGPV